MSNMAHLIHGEIRLNAKRMGQASDLMAILVSNGYVLEIQKITDLVKNKDEIVFTIMTEVDK